MKLATILDTETARLAGVPDAVGDLIVPHGLVGDAIATILPGNPLADDWFFPVDLPGDRLVAWSGGLGETLFADEPRTWMGEGHQRFERLCDEIREPLRDAGGRLCIRPHARHVLSDPQGTLDFLRRREDEPFGLALSPADLLLPHMLDAAEDHFERILEFMVPRCDLLIVADAAPDASEPDASDQAGGMRPCRLGEGVLPAERLMRAIDEGLPEEAWVVVPPADLPTMTAWRHGDLP